MKTLYMAQFKKRAEYIYNVEEESRGVLNIGMHGSLLLYQQPHPVSLPKHTKKLNWYYYCVVVKLIVSDVCWSESLKLPA